MHYFFTSIIYYVATIFPTIYAHVPFSSFIAKSSAAPALPRGSRRRCGQREEKRDKQIERGEVETEDIERQFSGPPPPLSPPTSFAAPYSKGHQLLVLFLTSSAVKVDSEQESGAHCARMRKRLFTNMVNVLGDSHSWLCQDVRLAAVVHQRRSSERRYAAVEGGF